MPLLERVTTLLRANVNALIDKAEDPEKMLKQLLLDMENQLLQVKTQVAIAVADQHLLEKKKREHDDAVQNWRRKAELAVGKGEDDLAIVALDRSLSSEQIAAGFAQQIEDQRLEAETMHSNYMRLQQKMKDTKAACDLLLAQKRRARTAGKMGKAAAVVEDGRIQRSLGRMRDVVQQQESINEAHLEIGTDSLEDRFRKLEREEKVQDLLLELKQKRLPSAS